MAIVRELSVKVSHVSGETTTLKFSPLADIYATTEEAVSDQAVYKHRIKQINSGTLESNYNASGQLEVLQPAFTVAYQSQLVSKTGSPASSITAATFTQTDSTRIYTRAAN